MTEYHLQQKLQQIFLAECYLLQDSWFDDPNSLAAMHDNLVLDTWESGECYFSGIPDPRLLAARAKTPKYNEDNPSFNTATCGPFQAQFCQAMQTKLNTLNSEFDCWDYVPNPGKNVLPSTWAFKIKYCPDGCIKKFKT